MLLSKIYRIFYKNILLVIVSAYLALIPQLNFSQSQNQHFLYNQVPEQPKSIFEVIFNFSEMNHGTKFAQPNKEKYSYIRKIQQDTTKENKIKSVWIDKDNLNAEVSLIDIDQKINISVYNLLGKKVFDIFDGLPQDERAVYVKPAVSIPNGVYLCVVLGKNFRLREKFIVSR